MRRSSRLQFVSFFFRNSGQLQAAEGTIDKGGGRGGEGGGGVEQHQAAPGQEEGTVAGEPRRRRRGRCENKTLFAARGDDALPVDALNITFEKEKRQFEKGKGGGQTIGTESSLSLRL